MQPSFTNGELIQSIDFQKKPGSFDEEYARVDHVHDLSAELYAKVARDSDGNFIDNPEFRISQRNFPTGSTPPIWQADRWQLAGNGGAVGNLAGTSTEIPPVAGVGFGARVTVTTADTSMLTTDYFFLQQAIEGFVFAEARFGTLQALDLTLSFWARSSVAGTFCASLRNGTVDRSFVREFSLEANAWKLVVLRFPGCKDGTWAVDSNTGVILNITLSCGPTFQTATPNTWVTTNSISTPNQTNFVAATSRTFDITGVKFETGAYSPFSRRRITEELLNCKRYLQVYQDPPLRGVWSSGTGATRVGMILPVEMRAEPVLTATGSAFIWDGITGAAVTSIAASYNSPRSVEHDIICTGGMVARAAAVVYWNGGTSTWTYSAEI